MPKRAWAKRTEWKEERNENESFQQKCEMLQQTRTQRKGKEHCAFVLLLLVHTTTLYVPIATLLKRRTLAGKDFFVTEERLYSMLAVSDQRS